jgi:hypothetical protein
MDYSSPADTGQLTNGDWPGLQLPAVSGTIYL